jgi:hypothetical protein
MQNSNREMFNKWKWFLRRKKITRLESEYFIHHSFLQDIQPSSDSILEKLGTFVSESAGTIVENIVGERPRYDENRQFRLLTVTELGKCGDDAIATWLQRVKNKMEGFFAVTDSKGKPILKNRYEFDGTVIRSLPGCRQQDIHADYPSDSDRETAQYSNYFLAVLAMQEGTKLLFLNTAKVLYKVNIPKGALLIANGLFLHSGASYDVENTRLHFYVHPSGVNYRKPADTFFVPSDVVKLIPGELQRFTRYVTCKINNWEKAQKRERQKRRCESMRASKKQKKEASINLSS